jgi:hypothetical protein
MLDLKIAAGQASAINLNNLVDVGEREGRAAREYAQGFAHGKQDREDLRGSSFDYDTGNDAGIAAKNKSTLMGFIVNRASSRYTVTYAAQKGVFFESMDDLCATLGDAGFGLTQRYADRVLAGYKAWVSVDGVVTPINSSNL